MRIEACSRAGHRRGNISHLIKVSVYTTAFSKVMLNALEQREWYAADDNIKGRKAILRDTLPVPPQGFSNPSW